MVWNDQTIMAAALEALGAFAIVATVVAALRLRSDVSAELADRLRPFVGDEGGGKEEPAPEPDLVRWKHILYRFRHSLQKSEGKSPRAGGTHKLAESLAQADLRLRTSEWHLIRLGATLALFVIGYAILSNIIVATGLGALGLAIPSIYLRRRRKKRQQKFNSKLGDALVLMSNALKAGYSFSQTIPSVAEASAPPISDEFRRASREIQLGIPTDEALQRMVSRVNSEDLDLAVTAIQVQRVVGGNLAESLDNIALTIRERARIKGEVRTLTAQARGGSYIITALPLGLALILQLLNPVYLRPMFSLQGPGPYILGGCAISIGVAFFIMRKITDIKA